MKLIQRTIWVIAFLFFGCDLETLVPLPPEPDAGEVVDAGEQIIPRPPRPDAGPEACVAEFIWPLETPPLGACRPGYRCGDQLIEPIFPETELCGNNQDDDCDGEVDERDSQRRRAVVAVVDGSGSMTGTRLVTLHAAICGGQFEGYHWALVLFGQSAVIASEFHTGTEQFCEALGDSTAGSVFFGAEEFVARGVRASVEPEAEIYTGNYIQLQWPPGATRSVLVVTDEPPQDPGITNGVPIVADFCEANGLRVDVITHSSNHNFWPAVTNRCGGNISSFPLVPSLLEQQLISLLGSGC